MENLISCIYQYKNNARTNHCKSKLNRIIIKLSILISLLDCFICQESLLAGNNLAGLSQNIIDYGGKSDSNKTNNNLTVNIGPPVELPSSNQAFPPIHNHNSSNSHDTILPIKVQSVENKKSSEMIDGNKTNQLSTLNKAEGWNHGNQNNSYYDKAKEKLPALVDYVKSLHEKIDEILNENGANNTAHNYEYHYVTIVPNTNETSANIIKNVNKALSSNPSKLPDQVIPTILNGNSTKKVDDSSAIVKSVKLSNMDNPSLENTTYHEFSLMPNPDNTMMLSPENPTELHGVKMTNGHLHFKNKTYQFYDPDRTPTSSTEIVRWEKYLFPITFFCGCLILIIFVGFVAYKIWRAIFSSTKYSEFDNERNDSMANVNRFTAEDKQEEFRRKELKGELEPAIFYKHQQDNLNTNNSTSKRKIQGLNLDFESSDRDSERQNKDIQEQIQKLHYDMSSRSSREFDKIEDPRVKNYLNKENSQHAI